MQTQTIGLSWRLQDAKAQFSAVVDGALRGVPQHVTRRGKQAVVVVSEQDFAALQNQGSRQAVGFVQHLRAMPTEPIEPTKPAVPRKPTAGQATGRAAQKRKALPNATAARAKLALRELAL